MIQIIFEAHGTTFDNEAHLSSGHNDVALSPLGIQQSKEMGERYKDDHFDAIFCSDLQRAYKSAEIGFGDKWPIIKDARLRECDYGDFTQHPSEEVDKQKPLRIKEPFPNGESYEQTTARMKSFLEDLKKNYDGKRVMIIGHRATQYGLEHLINGVPLENLTSMHFKWQPGWSYNFSEFSKNNLFRIARNRMYSALNAFYIYKLINQSININEDGGEEGVKNNLESVVNKYKYFFIQTLNNSYKTFIVDLAIFFDSGKYQESFSLRKLLAAVKLSESEHAQLESSIDNIIKPHRKTISLVTKLRNQDVAHQGIDPKQHVIVYAEIEGLFMAVQQVLNVITRYYDNSSTIWNHVEYDIAGDIKWIFDNLKRGEKQRLAEIKEKYGV